MNHCKLYRLLAFLQLIKQIIQAKMYFSHFDQIALPLTFGIRQRFLLIKQKKSSFSWFFARFALPLQRQWSKPRLLRGTVGKINCIGI